MLLNICIYAVSMYISYTYTDFQCAYAALTTRDYVKLDS